MRILLQSLSFRASRLRVTRNPCTIIIYGSPEQVNLNIYSIGWVVTYESLLSNDVVVYKQLSYGINYEYYKSRNH